MVGALSSKRDHPNMGEENEELFFRAKIDFKIVVIEFVQ